MTKVDPEEIESWLAALFLKGTAPNPKNPWGDVWTKKIDIPSFSIEKEVHHDKNFTKIRRYLKVRFNQHGRARKLYVEWPKAILMGAWAPAWFSREGLTETPVVAPYAKTITLLSGNDTGKAVYTKHSDAIWVLAEYEGTVK